MRRTSCLFVVLLFTLGCSNARNDGSTEEKGTPVVGSKPANGMGAEGKAKETIASAQTTEVKPTPAAPEGDPEGPYTDVPTLIRSYVKDGNEDSKLRGQLTRVTGRLRIKGSIGGPWIHLEKLPVDGGEANVSWKMKSETDLRKLNVGDTCTIIGTCVAVVHDPAAAPPYWEVLLENGRLLSGKAESQKQPLKESNPVARIRSLFKAFDPGRGSPFYQTQTTKTRQKTKQMGKDVVQESTQVSYLNWIPEGRDAGGNWAVKLKIVGLKTRQSVAGKTFSYDSTSLDSPTPGIEYVKALVGTVLVYTIDPKAMKVVKVEGTDALIRRAAGTNRQLEPLLKGIWGEEAFKRTGDIALLGMPGVEADTTATQWEGWQKHELGSFGGYQVTYAFGCNANEGEMFKIDINGTASYVPPNKGKGELGFTIDEAHLSGPVTGYTLFDPKRGRFEKCEMETTLVGKLDIDMAGTKSTVELVQHRSDRIEASDTSPLSLIAQPKKQWFNGGTLHRVTLAQWQEETYANRLATVADFIVAYLGGEGVERKSINMTRLRPAAIWILEAMENKVEGMDTNPLLSRKLKGRTTSLGFPQATLAGPAAEFANRLLRENPEVRKLLRYVYD